ncbi:PTS sugar transporter subunit IIA [Euzebya tangerina]|uniref:PTS sugar transporter subunit IIA n=1 Tax=Euzebya tangerina TaxID=591198 RepID=UPI00196AEC3C|nr:PTS sugar transporter subunit IIA [Euzebya tangerina]
MSDSSTGAAAGIAALLPREAIKLGLPSTTREDAVEQAGAVLVSIGAVESHYAEAMQEREQMVSSFVGEGVAIPHGTNEAKKYVRRASLAFLQFPDGIDWEGQDVKVAIAIAAAADEHLAVMSALATILMDADQAEALRSTDDPDRVLALLSNTARS